MVQHTKSNMQHAKTFTFFEITVSRVWRFYSLLYLWDGFHASLHLLVLWTLVERWMGGAVNWLVGCLLVCGCLTKVLSPDINEPFSHTY